MGQRDKFDPLYRALVERLIRERKAAGLTQTELASRMGTDQSHVSKFERGERRMDIIDFLKFCRALRIDSSGLLRVLLEDPQLGAREDS